MLFITYLATLFIISVSAQKKGQECTIKRTNTLGVCTQVSECETVRREYYKSGLEPTFCDRSYNSILVCCNDNSNIFHTPAYERRPVWGSAALVTQTSNQRLSDRKCEEYGREVTEVVEYISLVADPEKMTYSAPKCEYEKVQLIVGGQDAEQGEFPHMAAIGWLDVTDNYVFHCGGSLISSRFILTAGHCIKSTNRQFKNAVPQIVRLGDQNLNPAVNDRADPVDVQIKSIHKHPLYDAPNKYHDIALFELNTDVDFSHDIRPACLWTKPDFPGYKSAVATGWGVVDPNRPGQTSDELKKVSLSLLDNEYCNRTIRQNRLWNGTSEEQMCAGELRGGKDTCQGDSGSPLQVASFSNKCIFHIVGVTSFGKDCAKSGKPAIYTRVSSYLDWIESVVWPGE